MIFAAERAAYWAHDWLTELYPLDEDEIARLDDLTGSSVSTHTVSMAQTIREIGLARATPQVLMQQLVIDKHRQSAEATPAELMIVKIFSMVLTELDAFDRQYQADLAAARRESERRDPDPLPLNETMLEGVDDPLGII